MTGNLYLIPNTLGESEINQVIPSGVLDIIHSLDHFIVENVRSARRFLLKSGYTKNINEAVFFILNKHTSKNDMYSFLGPCQKGRNTGILSEAGVPAIADPGAEIIEYAHKIGIRVIPLTGPSSILLALMASGLSGQSFSFLGYLPIKREELHKKIKEIEARSERDKQTQIFIETPYRNIRLFEALLRTCKPATILCIAVNLTTKEERITVRKIAEWNKSKPDIDGKPTVFLIGCSLLFNIKEADFKYKGRIRPD